jgi:hypothetical protein
MHQAICRQLSDKTDWLLSSLKQVFGIEYAADCCWQAFALPGTRKIEPNLTLH